MASQSSLAHIQPAYQRFGFSRHNGVDVAHGEDKLIRAPFTGRVRPHRKPTRRRRDLLRTLFETTDETELSAESLAHIVVYKRGRRGVERREHFIVLSVNEEHRLLTTVMLE